ncbi:MAG: cupin domain-containing protein, partial [Microbacterium sp.]
MARFVVRRAAEAQYEDPGHLAPGAVGVTRWRGVGEADGAAHTDFGITRLAAGGRTATHVHSFEESFHVLEGEVILATPEATVHLVAGDYGVIPIGVPHVWRSAGDQEAAWADLFTPPARERYGSDTYQVPEIPERDPISVDTRDPRTRSFGNITDEHMNPGGQSQELLAVSASSS